jgi:hypothetical protein
MTLFEAWDRIPSDVLTWVSVLSILTFLVSLIVVPIICARIPSNYFHSSRQPETRFRQLHPLAHIVIWIVRNVISIVLICGGILMLVLPGQGLLTILIGVGVADFPGKFRLEKRLVSLPGVFSAINWVRRKAGVEPLLVVD